MAMLLWRPPWVDFRYGMKRLGWRLRQQLCRGSSEQLQHAVQLVLKRHLCVYGRTLLLYLWFLLDRSNDFSDRIFWGWRQQPLCDFERDSVHATCAFTSAWLLVGRDCVCFFLLLKEIVFSYSLGFLQLAICRTTTYGCLSFFG